MTRREDLESDESRYGDELLSTGWNPVLDLLQWSVERTRGMTRDEAPAARSDAEAAAFLSRIYTSL
ncbi:MAG TPA: hypothetical protein VHP37_16060 [Burkholderiales bacterium]|nr:hypothetical protein [Burkholderiales bacterium]